MSRRGSAGLAGVNMSPPTTDPVRDAAAYLDTTTTLDSCPLCGMGEGGSEHPLLLCKAAQAA
eukprot:11822861-Prorocentrum_lima.AAC.1